MTITVHKVFLRWFYNLQYSGSWDDYSTVGTTCEYWSVILALWRLRTLNLTLLVCRSWYVDQMALMDEGVDYPSLIFNWQRESYKSARLLGQQRFCTELQKNQIVKFMKDITDIHFMRNCEIANQMAKWRPQRRRDPADVTRYAHSQLYTHGRLICVNNPQEFKFGSHTLTYNAVRAVP